MFSPNSLVVNDGCLEGNRLVLNIYDDGRPKLENPKTFGFKCAWLAIKTQDIDKVVKALELKNIRVANWTSGFEARNEINGEVFVSPPLGEWILVIGLSLPQAGIYLRRASSWWQ